MAKKKPRTKHRPQDTKKPAVTQHRPDPGIEGVPLAWRFKEADQGGPFAWSNLNDPIKYKEIIEKLSELEQLDQAIIKRRGNHPIPVEKIEKSTRDRLVEIKKDDIDEILSLRLTGTERVWAIQRLKHRNILRVLWWDPNHSVYKVEPDKADRRKRKNRR